MVARTVARTAKFSSGWSNTHQLPEPRSSLAKIGAFAGHVDPVDAGLGVLAVSFIFTDRPVSSSPETPDTMTMSDCLRAPREDFQG